MEISVYFKKDNPEGLLVETHSFPEHTPPQCTYEEEWGTVTYDGAMPLAFCYHLAQDSRGIYVWKSSTENPYQTMLDDLDPQIKEQSRPAMPKQSKPDEYVVVPHSKLCWVDRIEADGVQVWPESQAEDEDFAAMEEKLRSLMAGM